MKIKVVLYGKYKEDLGRTNIELEMDAADPVKVCEKLNIQCESFIMFLVNGIRVNKNSELKDGDELHIFQPVGGG